MCAFVSLDVKPVSSATYYVRSLISNLKKKKLDLSCARMCLKWRVYMPLGDIFFEGVPVVDFMHLVFTHMPCESYRRRLRSLSCLCDVFSALIKSLVC